MYTLKMMIAFLALGLIQCIASASDKPVIMVYETDPKQLERKSDNFLFRQINELETRRAIGDQIETVGLGEKWNGWGSKAKHISAKLENVHPEQVVAIVDSRDVLLNNIDGASAEQMMAAFKKLTKDNENAVVVGAESQCCVSALTHAQPGEYLTDDLKRTGKEACNSGQPDCFHQGKEREMPWINKIKDLAAQRKVDSHIKNIYPNTGIIIGRAKNIKNVYEIMNMKETEDDQALFTELMLKRPDLIVLDYEQELIGNNDWTDGMNGCIYEWSKDLTKFVHARYKTVPTFLHFQGKFFECYGKMAKNFGYVGNMRRKLESRSLADSNYGPGSAGASITYSGLLFASVIVLATQLTH